MRHLMPVYYGGNLCDSKELEEYDTLDLGRAAYAEDDNFNAPEGMDLMTYNHNRPDGGETRGVDTIPKLGLLILIKHGILFLSY